MPNYECQDSDCQELCGDAFRVQPLVMQFGARTYPPGQYGKITLTKEKIYPTYSLLKCPYCRGQLKAFPNVTPAQST